MSGSGESSTELTESQLKLGLQLFLKSRWQRAQSSVQRHTTTLCQDHREATEQQGAGPVVQERQRGGLDKHSASGNWMWTDSEFILNIAPSSPDGLGVDCESNKRGKNNFTVFYLNSWVNEIIMN